MNTARELALWCRDSMTALSKSPDYGSLIAVFGAVAARSGLGKQTITNFYYGSKDNPTVDTLDRMACGIKALYRELAA